MSYARAASSAVVKVPSHTQAALCGSRISATHLPHDRRLTPRYFNCDAACSPSSTAGAEGAEEVPSMAAGASDGITIGGGQNQNLSLDTSVISNYSPQTRIMGRHTEQEEKERE
ncbi:hypothetical protein ZIOFF_010903 [Zingiber officinale]|uniref:Uncharacterized protein n=1 Tax=Zingiber officinale TaxID=94328 RepID=A0A8J5HMN0_ZINOF|nr:hypothetical protein ZIOFF_010903 [Zingiber officinale]